jgi:hypothetical protein
VDLAKRCRQPFEVLRRSVVADVDVLRHEWGAVRYGCEPPDQDVLDTVSSQLPDGLLRLEVSPGTHDPPLL